MIVWRNFFLLCYKIGKFNLINFKHILFNRYCDHLQHQINLGNIFLFKYNIEFILGILI